MVTAGALTTWFRNQFGEDLVAGGGDAYEGLAAEAGASPLGSRGLVVSPTSSGSERRYLTLGPWGDRGVVAGAYARDVYGRS